LLKGYKNTKSKACGEKILTIIVTVIVFPTSSYHSRVKSEYFPCITPKEKLEFANKVVRPVLMSINIEVVIRT
jgi:hypothetical protein